MTIPFDKLKQTLKAVLDSRDFAEESSELIANLFSESSLDGYHSHGVNRFAEFIKNVDKGVINPRALPQKEQSFGAIERWDGHRGAGPSNAWICMDRAMALARKYTIGCLALRNTNHWMRGGSYGWQAAEGNCMAICFTNTMPNMPPWGGTTPTTGNNPLIMAVPRKDGHVVMDISLSQFSYGKLWQHKLQEKPLPFPGGYDADGNLTTDPAEIIATRRILQTGYWKGSGLSVMIDLLASLLSAGQTTADIGKEEAETGLSQVFLCFDQEQLNSSDDHQDMVNRVIEHFTGSVPENGKSVHYPGEQTRARRQQALQNGIEVADEIWEKVVGL